MAKRGGGKIILTRPKAQAIEFSKKLFQIIEKNNKNRSKSDNFDDFIDGHILFSPATEIRDSAVNLPPPDDLDGLVLTSANALTDTIDWSAYAHLPLYLVGEATAEKARMRGLCNIREICRTVDVLKPIVHNECAMGKRLLYVRGKHVASDLKYGDENLWAEVVTYRAEPCSIIPPNVMESLRTGEAGFVAFFSARSARIFLDLIVAYNLTDQMKNLKALCLSEAVLECVQPFFDRQVYVSKTPETDAMLILVHEAIVKGYSKE
jgi:uroporphyrinogen-III synthase